LATAKKKTAELEEQNRRLQQEIDDTKTAAAISEATKEEYVTEIRRQCDEEIKSLQIIMKGLYCFPLL
jgi:predicted  nucleic acid-binding Zn-ribbon protein